MKNPDGPTLVVDLAAARTWNTKDGACTPDGSLVRIVSSEGFQYRIHQPEPGEVGRRCYLTPAPMVDLGNGVRAGGITYDQLWAKEREELKAEIELLKQDIIETDEALNEAKGARDAYRWCVERLTAGKGE
jgi:hypothetical protein